MLDSESLVVKDSVKTPGVLLEKGSFVHRSHDFCLPARSEEAKGAYPDPCYLRLLSYSLSTLLFYRVSAHRTTANLMPMEAECRTLKCCMVHKTLKLGEPLYLYERFMFRKEVACVSPFKAKTLLPDSWP
ncbi:hypothetical protein J6590_031467 [Homalodisca vitripennis]|nr:hypothetical protein J6590_031467 [Homalodisca vitripennis]